MEFFKFALLNFISDPVETQGSFAFSLREAKTKMSCYNI